MLNSVLIRAFKYVWNTQKKWVIFNLIYSLISGLFPIATIWLTKELINAVTSFLAGEQNEYVIIVVVVLQTTLMLSESLLNVIKKVIDEKCEVRLGHNVKSKILRKAASVTMDIYDDPNFYNRLNRIEHSAGGRFLSPVNELFSFFSNLISAISVGAFLLSIHWGLLLVALIPLIPYFFIKLKYGKQRFNLFFNYTPLLRDAEITSRLITNRNSAKEVKVFGLSNHLINRWSTKFLENGFRHLQLSKRQHYSLFGIDGFGMIVYALIVFLLLTVIHRSSALVIGDFVAIIQAVQNTQAKTEVASENVAKIIEDRLYLEDFFNFIDEEYTTTTINDKELFTKFPSPLKSAIRFENLSYSYFNSSVRALDQVSFTIKPGEKNFIVGENGSGKSTLIKILLGLYPIQQGDIKFDGISIRNINNEELRKNLTVLFQDFVKYPYTIYENIGFGDIEKIDRMHLVNAVSEETGADKIVHKYPNKYETYLTKTLYDGEDLSGGQWQKIALTRALFRNTQLVVLDEPTSALDPKKEREVFRQFNDIAKDKTAIYISHRMSAAKLADHIIVLKDGKIIEDGTFEELMIKEGEFKEMYEIQSSQFKDEDINVLL